MDFVYVTCEHGHRLKANTSLRGKTFSCPVCRLSVTVPLPDDPLSDTGVMRILGDIPPLPPSPEPLRSQLRPCPGCGAKVRNELTVCNACQCYIGHSPDYLKELRHNPRSFG